MSASTSPSSSISNPDTNLPTPEMSTSSRRPSLVLSDAEDSNQEKVAVADVFSPSLPPPHGIHFPLVPAPTMRTSSAARAPPPPPILIRRPTDMGSTTIPAPLSSGSSTSSLRGLNISGTLSLSGEGEDSLTDLAPSPRRMTFPTIPASPAWPSLEPPFASPIPGRSLQPRLDVPLSPLGAGRRRFDPTPMHGIHSRNLSLFFPQPGETLPSSPLSRSPEVAQEARLPDNRKKPFGGSETWKFGKSVGEEDDLRSPDGVKRSRRRGHHVRFTVHPSS